MHAPPPPPPPQLQRRAILDFWAFVFALTLFALTLAESLQPNAYLALGAITTSWQCLLLVLLLAPRTNAPLELARALLCIGTLVCNGVLSVVVVWRTEAADSHTRLACFPASLDTLKTAHFVHAQALGSSAACAGFALYTLARYSHQQHHGQSYRRYWRLDMVLAVCAALALGALFALDSVAPNSYHALGAYFAWQVYTLFVPFVEFPWPLLQQQQHAAPAQILKQRATLVHALLRTLVFLAACAHAILSAVNVLASVMRRDDAVNPPCVAAGTRSRASDVWQVALLCALACVQGTQSALYARAMLAL